MAAAHEDDLLARRNYAMLGLARRLGMRVGIDPDEPGLIRAELAFDA